MILPSLLEHFKIIDRNMNDKLKVTEMTNINTGLAYGYRKSGAHNLKWAFKNVNHIS